jgi:hypothetical protein
VRVRLPNIGARLPNIRTRLPNIRTRLPDIGTRLPNTRTRLRVHSTGATTIAIAVAHKDGSVASVRKEGDGCFRKIQELPPLLLPSLFLPIFE